MTFKKLISLCEPIEVSGTEPDTIGVLTQDSRKVTDGSVFIAIRGTQVDGHDFIDAAIQKGASVVISEESLKSDEEVCVIKVEDTRSLIGPLAQAFEGNPAEKLSVIGITGTNGKTTVATLAYQVLQKLDAKVSLLGTVDKRINDKKLESRLTTADPIELAADMAQMVEAKSEFLVMEVSSHALDQERVKGIDFQVAAFTNLSHDHLDYHENMKEYARSKKKLFDGLDSKASAIINADDKYAELLASDCKAQITNFSFKNNPPVRRSFSEGGQPETRNPKHVTRNSPCQIISNSSKGLQIRVDETEIKSPLIGDFNAYNIAEAFLICRELGFEVENIAKALETATGASGRLERIATEEGKPVVLVDYAHTPDALKNVLSTLAELKTSSQKLHVVFGCGGNRDKTKRPEMARIAERYANGITVTSDNPRNESPDSIIDDIMKGFEYPNKVQRITDRREAIIHAIQAGDEQTMILIAGKGHETYQEIKGKRYDFDDRQIAREALENSNGNPKNEVA
ncbi:MAG TPA: UDP-N-acetylmuramoyl-L-alanyl-D-glutamate--2,6-diaminopimelate ligase [Balneolaceae bacterium]|nr:UDP-N-acetylmuramoyl-L-alanyl-D-glutamate--2,6-diaminopimelate ligase [Balneolaceae bacterium]